MGGTKIPHFYGQMTAERVNKCLRLHAEYLIYSAQAHHSYHFKTCAIYHKFLVVPHSIAKQRLPSGATGTKVQPCSYCQQWRILIRRLGLAERSTIASNYPSSRPQFRIATLHFQRVTKRFS